MSDSSGWVDLHIHTTASDGTYTPSEIVRMARDRGLRAIAITDHDSLNGVPEAMSAAEGSGLKVISGVEMSTDVKDGEVHLLGYFLDLADSDLQALLTTLRNSRTERALRMTQNLTRLGVPITMERVLELAKGGAVGRPHVAQALKEAGHVSSIQDAFSMYIGRTGPAYVERYRLTPEEAVSHVLRHGGVPVLAHPRFVPNVELLLPGLVAAGLAGMEVYYTGYSEEEVATLGAMAGHYGLVRTGGSDFHGPGVQVNAVLGGVAVPYAAVEGLRARLPARAAA